MISQKFLNQQCVISEEKHAPSPPTQIVEDDEEIVVVSDKEQKAVEEEILKSIVQSPIVPPMVVVEGCPCILQGGKNKGTVCGKKIKAMGHCGIHQNKCVLPVPPVIRGVSPVVERAPEVVVSVLLEPVVPAQQDNGKCKCILQGGKSKGKECGRKVTANGCCGIHQNKCVKPVREPSPSPVRAQQSVPQVVEVIIPLPSESTTCPCLIQSGKNKGNICGKKVKAHGRCGIHQNKCGIADQALPPAVYEAKSPAQNDPIPKESVEDVVEDATGPDILDVILDAAIEEITAPVQSEVKWTTKKVSLAELQNLVKTIEPKSISILQFEQIDREIEQALRL